MNYSLQYIRIEFKRAVHALLSGMVTLIIIALITAGSAAALYTLLQSLGVSEPVRIAVSVPGDGSMSRMAIRLLEGMDSVRSVCEFELTDEDDARSGVGDGRYGAAIILPEHFYEDVDTGVNTPALILIPSELSDPVRDFGELLETSVSLVDTVEGGIYAVTDAYLVYGMKVSRYDMETYLTGISFDTLLSRTKMFKESFEASFDADSFVSYLAVSGCLLILMVTATGFGYMYSARKKAVEYALRRNGLGPVKTGFVRLTMMMFQLMAVAAVYILIILAASRVFLDSENEMLVLAGESLWEALYILCDLKNLIPVLFCICGFTHLIYSLFKGREDSGLILLMIFMIMLILGGCIVPSVFLPDTPALIGSYLPAALWRNDIFSGGILRELLLGSLFFAGGEVTVWVYT